jgi:hypothetical protein
MKPVTRILVRILDKVMEGPGYFVSPPWGMIDRQIYMPATKALDKTYPSIDTDKKNMDPNDKSSWSRGPRLLWLHNTQDSKKSNTAVKASLLQDLLYSMKHWPYIDLREGRVHISRYFP